MRMSERGVYNTFILQRNVHFNIFGITVFIGYYKFKTHLRWMKEALLLVVTAPFIAIFTMLKGVSDFIKSFLPSVSYYKLGTFKRGYHTFDCERTVDEIKKQLNDDIEEIQEVVKDIEQDE